MANKSPEVAQIIIQKGAGFPANNKDIKLLESANTTTLNCPAPILRAFRETLKDTRVLGAYFANPYTGKTEQFPRDPNLLTARHLQILARNEKSNTTGVMRTDLYHGLLTDDQIARIRCLVKATVVGGLTQAHHTGGYRSERHEIAAPLDTIVIDQAGLQWQGDFRNTGGMFFYPANPNDQSLPENYAQWQSDMYRVMYGRDRPETPTDFIEVTWTAGVDRVKGKIDLQGVANAIEAEFRQDLDAAVEQGKYLPEGSDPINFKFVKAGMGAFAEGLGLKQNPEGQIKLEAARLKGIKQALEGIAKLSQADRKALLGKVERLELPFSNINNPIIDNILHDIEVLTSKIGLQWGGAENRDALAPTPGYINATNNAGDTHAPIKNEAGIPEKSHQSVDASIGLNSDLDGHNPAINEKMQVRASPSCRPGIFLETIDKKIFTGLLKEIRDVNWTISENEDGDLEARPSNKWYQFGKTDDLPENPRLGVDLQKTPDGKGYKISIEALKAFTADAYILPKDMSKWLCPSGNKQELEKELSGAKVLFSDKQNYFIKADSNAVAQIKKDVLNKKIVFLQEVSEILNKTDFWKTQGFNGNVPHGIKESQTQFRARLKAITQDSDPKDVDSLLKDLEQFATKKILDWTPSRTETTRNFYEALLHQDKNTLDEVSWAQTGEISFPKT